MKRQQIIGFCREYLPLLLLVLFYLSEGYGKYANLYLFEKAEVAKVIKFGVFLFFGVALLLKKSRWLFYPLLLAGVFGIGQLVLGSGFHKDVVISFSKYLYPLFLLAYFTYYPLQKTARTTFLQAFEWLIVANSVLVFIGYFMDFPLFSSYRTRFGYNGLFIVSATGSYVYILAMLYFLISRKERFFTSWKSLFLLATCVLIGAKAVYLGVFITLIAYLLFYANLSQKNKKLLLGAILISAALAFYFFFFHYGKFNALRESEGFFSALLSLRNDLLMERALPFIQENWTWGNYLFGGIANMETRSQMGVIDVFYFWGIIGGVAYLWSFYKTFVTFRLNKEVVFLLLGLLVIVFLAGNFFENASVAIYLLVLREALLKERPTNKT